MDKPISLIIEETKNGLANVCNKSGLPPIILDLILQGIYSEVHTLAEKQMSKEKEEYIKKFESEKD